MAVGTRSGFKEKVNGDLELYINNTLVATFTTTGITFAVSASLPQALTIGGVAYTFPADDGEDTNQLTSNGSGVLAWLPADDGAA